MNIDGFPSMNINGFPSMGPFFGPIGQPFGPHAAAFWAPSHLSCWPNAARRLKARGPIIGPPHPTPPQNPKNTSSKYNRNQTNQFVQFKTNLGGVGVWEVREHTQTSRLARVSPNLVTGKTWKSIFIIWGFGEHHFITEYLQNGRWLKLGSRLWRVQFLKK